MLFATGLFKSNSAAPPSGAHTVLEANREAPVGKMKSRPDWAALQKSCQEPGGGMADAHGGATVPLQGVFLPETAIAVKLAIRKPLIPYVAGLPAYQDAGFRRNDGAGWNGNPSNSGPLPLAPERLQGGCRGREIAPRRPTPPMEPGPARPKCRQWP